MSSTANQEHMLEYAKEIGNNQIADLKLFYLKFRPIRNEKGLVASMDCTLVISSNPGTPAPQLKSVAKF